MIRAFSWNIGGCPESRHFLVRKRKLFSMNDFSLSFPVPIEIAP